MEIIIILLIITNIITLLYLILRRDNSKPNSQLQSQVYIQKQLENILDTMNQAILLFNHKSKLLFYNKIAKKVLNLDEESLKLHATSIFENKEIRDAIINQTELSVFDVIDEETIYAVNIFTTTETIRRKKRISVVVTLKNVTETRSIEKTKKDFFSHASHELKSPLTAIIGYSELATLNMIDKEEYSDIFNRIYKQAIHMSDLVEEMSTLSRLELVHKDDNYEALDLEKVLKQVLESLEPFKKEKEMEFIVESQPIDFRGNNLDLNKLFKNLIENAIKYSYKNDSIHIDLYKHDGSIYFIVQDNGIGIMPKHQQRIFERFYRIDKGRIISGTGLGLAIVKHILIKYKGEIKVDSKLNVGTKITVILKNL